MEKDLNVLIIGGVACGPKVGARLKRLMPQAKVTILEKGNAVSYGSCGLPYYIEGCFDRIDILCETSVGILRSPEYFKNVKDIDIKLRTEAIKIDRENKKVIAKNLESGKEEVYEYDKLIIATGGEPIKPPIKGVDLENVFQLRTLEDAENIDKAIKEQGLKKAVLIGAGYIGMEMAEALKERGLEVTIVEMLEHVMPKFLDSDIARVVEKHLISKGVNLVLKERVVALEGDKKVKKVKTDKKEIEADLVIMAIGVRPNDKLAKECGLNCHPKGGIIVNSYCQTSDPDIYAGGDCVLNNYIHPIFEGQLFVPLGSTANKHGRVIANHIAGMPTPFKGIGSTGICKAFEFNVGRTGLTERDAKALNFDIEVALWAGPDYLHYYPGSNSMLIKLIACKKTRKVLGAQVVGLGKVDKRLDVIATTIYFGGTLEDLVNVDLGYAPPYSPPIDPVASAAQLLINKLDGIAKCVSSMDIKDRMDKGEDLILLDVRTPKEYEQMRIEDPRVVHIPLGQLRKRYKELPKDKEIYAFCKISLRGYEAQRILNSLGYDNVWFVGGGIIAWPGEIKKK